MKIYEDNIVKTLKLYSYDKLVALITFDKIGNKVQYDYLGYFSQTTKRHQKEFFRQHDLTDKEIDALFNSKRLYVEKEVIK